MPRVVHFEMTVKDPDRAIAFYEKVLGWKVQKWGDMDYWLISTGDGEGIDGAFMRSDDGTMKTVNTIDVASLDEALEQVVAHGGQVLSQRQAVPGVGWWAACIDTEGNLIGLMQFDRTVKG